MGIIRPIGLICPLGWDGAGWDHLKFENADQVHLIRDHIDAISDHIHLMKPGSDPGISPSDSIQRGIDVIWYLIDASTERTVASGDQIDPTTRPSVLTASGNVDIWDHIDV